MSGRVATLRPGWDGNPRSGCYRPEQKDLLPERLGARARCGERSAERIDEIEQRGDRRSHLRRLAPTAVPDEREDLTTRIDLVEEGGEADEPSPDRRARRRLDRSASQQRDEIEHARPEPSHPVANRPPRDVMCPRNRGDRLLPQPRSSDLDHVLDRARLAWHRRTREHTLFMPTLAPGESSADPSRAEMPIEPRLCQLELN